jgi:hypothetical protein
MVVGEQAVRVNSSRGRGREAERKRVRIDGRHSNDRVAAAKREAERRRQRAGDGALPGVCWGVSTFRCSRETRARSRRTPRLPSTGQALICGQPPPTLGTLRTSNTAIMGSIDTLPSRRGVLRLLGARVQVGEVALTRRAGVSVSRRVHNTEPTTPAVLELAIHGRMFRYGSREDQRGAGRGRNAKRRGKAPTRTPEQPTAASTPCQHRR